MIPPQICFTSLSQAEISFVQNVSARKKTNQTKKQSNIINNNKLSCYLQQIKATYYY